MLKVAPTRTGVNVLTTDTLNDEERELRVRRIWRSADAVCFDVDSTVCQDEAIDELAGFLGKGDQITKYTQRAMNGGMTFRQALEDRLDIMRPSREQLETYALTNPPKLTPGIRELVEALRARDVDVFLVSGGFRYLIIPVARMLNIPMANIFANELLFDKTTGAYAGFDLNELTSDSGSKKIGKAGVCGMLKKKFGYTNLVMVGDGATDMEASPPADAFIGFGGNQVRDNVRRHADWFVYNCETLCEELDK